jgi:DNA-binding MarR family transcriptional regulator
MEKNKMSKKMASMPLIRILWLIRDARSTKNSERELLYALALRCNPNKNYSCWPSYRLLAEDTQLDPATLQRAAKLLEGRQLIKRAQRRNRSNYFYLNIRLLQEQAAAVEEREKEKAPFESPDLEDRLEEDTNEDLIAAITGGGE